MSDEPRRSRLPDWAVEVLAEAPEGPRAVSIQEQHGQPAWPLFVEAATVSSFLPRDLLPGVLEGAERKEAEKAVLRFAELSHDEEVTRWSLTRDARRAVLASCEASEIAGAVARTTRHSADPVNAALREIVSGKKGIDLHSLDIHTLEAMRLASAWVSGITQLTVPSAEELDRHIELKRVLAPFERMTHKTGRHDRFFGRGEELEALREYVGVIAADSIGRRVKRAVKAVKRVWTGRNPMSIWGTGGVGKTTLIAKFMLEHAQAAASKFPFAYLDFDRSTLSVGNPAGLLSEMCRQVAAQFHEIAKPMADLRGQLAGLQRSVDPSSTISLVSSLAYEFRKRIDETLTNAGPFLLVFDTFEVVQCGADQLQDLEYLVYSLHGNDNWKRLRLIISGRAHVKSFLGETEALEIGALDLEGSAKMLEALARDAGKPIDIEEAERLVQAISKVLRDPTNDGVRPLRLRLIGDLFEKETESGPVIVQSLLDELAKPVGEQTKLGRVLIEGILVRRILGHVRDPRVRALADPGLVVRRITKDVILHVMTQGTAKPNPDRDADAAPLTEPDETPQPWTIDDSEAQDIFEAFEREVALVERDGDALRHRQDVRREMLLLIEGSKPKAFRHLHQLAYDFLRADEKDAGSPGEAAYHGLWLGKPLPELDELWKRTTRDPGIDPDEFPPGSPANRYLRAKQNRPLTADEVTLLPLDLQLDWLLLRRNEMLATVRNLEDVAIVREIAGKDWKRLDNAPVLAAMAARMLYRAGMWNDAMTLLRRHVKPRKPPGDDADISMLRTWTTILAKSDIGNELGWTLEKFTISDPLIETELIAHAAIGLRRSASYLGTWSRFQKLVGGVSATLWRREPRILRLAIACGLDIPDELFETYVNLTVYLPRDRSVVEILFRIFGGKVGIEDVNDIWDGRKEELLKLRDGRFVLRRLAAADYSDWTVPFGNALTRGFDEHHKAILRAVKKVFSKRRIAEAERLVASGDGHSLVQTMMTEGCLMDFAAALSPQVSNARVPSSAPEIANALVQWHRKLVDQS